MPRAREPTANEDPSVVARRRRQRDLKRVSRLRKKLEVEDMQERVRQLDEQYQRLWQAKAQQVSQSPLQQQYAETMEQIRQLHAENATLQSKLVEHDRFSSALESYLDDVHGPFAPSRLSRLRSPSPAPLPWPGSAEVQLMTENECLNIIQSCYQHIVRPQWRGKCLSTGAQMLGWRDERYIEGTTLQFSFTKSFPGGLMERMVSKTWDVLTQVEEMRKIQASVVSVQVEQRVTNDIFIVRRRVSHPHMNKVTAARLLVFRLRTERGYTIAYTSIHHVKHPYHDSSSDSDTSEPRPSTSSDQRAGEGATDSWVELFQWFTFEQHPEFVVDTVDDTDLGAPVSRATPMDMCRVTFGGKLDNRELSYVSFFLVEIVSCIVRWDSAVGCSMLEFSHPAAS